MIYLTDQIIKTLKQTRKRKGLSQRVLSTKSGVPQGHISKIENGAVDLRVSSLIALARVLDLELELVPRNAVPAVKAITRSSVNANETSQNKLVQKEKVDYLQDSSALPAYRLDDADDELDHG